MFYSLVSRFDHARHIGQRITDGDIDRLVKLEQACQEVLVTAIPLAPETTYATLLKKAHELKTALFQTLRTARPQVSPQPAPQPATQPATQPASTGQHPPQAASPASITVKEKASPARSGLGQVPHQLEARCFICFAAPNHSADGCVKFIAMNVDDRAKVVGNGSRC